MAYPLMAQELREQRELAVATIQRQNELYESVSQQLQDAREENQRKDAYIEELRSALSGLVFFANEELRDNCNCARCLAIRTAETVRLKGTAND